MPPSPTLTGISLTLTATLRGCLAREISNMMQVDVTE